MPGLLLGSLPQSVTAFDGVEMLPQDVCPDTICPDTIYPLVNGQR